MGTPFDADLARLADLSDDELATLEAAIVAAFEQADSAGDDAQMEALAAALDSIRTEVEQRAGATPVPASAASEESPPEAAAETAAAETPEPEPEAAATEPEAAEKAEPVAAAVVTPATKKGPIQVPVDRTPVVTSGGSTAVVAGADIPGYSAGTALSSYPEFTKAFAARINTLMRLSGGDGEKVIVASIKTPEVPDAQMLYSHDPEGNAEKMRAAIEPSAITAAGCCSPLTTQYDIFGVGITDRPLRSALPGFQTDRGGIRYYVEPTVGAATGYWTCADQAAVGPTGPEKICAEIDCPTEKTAEIAAITFCLTVNNIQSRVHPELVSRVTQTSLVQQARFAESQLLAKIKAAAVTFTAGTAKFGITRDLLNTVAQEAAYFRDAWRIGVEAPLRVILPGWVLDAIRADLTSSPPSTAVLTDNFGISNAEIAKFFSDRNLNVTWTLDTAVPGTNGGGQYAKVGNGALPAWPTTVEWAMFAEGAFVYLDGGELDVGVIRDTALVKTNKFTTFSEVFETVAYLGGPAAWMSTAVTVAGKYACCV